MNHIFHQQHAPAPDHGSNGVPACHRHGAGGWVVQRWGAEQQLGVESLGGPVQRIREQLLNGQTNIKPVGINH